MAHTLSDMMLGAYRSMGLATVGTATAGSSTTLSDSSLITTTQDNQFNNAVLFIISDGGATTAIAGQARKVTSYAASSGQFTFTSLAGSVNASAVYAFTTPEFGLELMTELANDALRALGPLQFMDKNTITSSSPQQEYTAQLAWKYAKPDQIDLQTRLGSTANYNDWVTLHNWSYEPSTAGATGRLIFGDQLPTGRKVRVWFRDLHHRVTASTALIDERVHLELCIISLMEKCYQFRNSLTRGSEPFDVQRWKDVEQQLQKAKGDFPIWRERRQPKIFALGDEAKDHAPWVRPYGPG